MMVNAIVGLPVETRSGKHLGKITGIDIDPKTHVVTCYHVSSSTFVKKIITDAKDLLIHPTQVLSLSPRRMVVADMNINEPVDVSEWETKRSSQLPLRSPQPMNTTTP